MEGVCSRAENCALSEGRGITVLLTEALRPSERSQGVTVRPAYDSQPLASAEDGREHREVHNRQDCACRKGDHPRGEDAADDPQVERRDPARHADPENRAYKGVGGGNRQAETGSTDDGGGSGQLGGETAARRQLGDVLADGGDDLVAIG